MYNFYVLQSQKDNSYYYGSTDNLERRLKEHSDGESKYTRNKRPWKLIHSEKYKTLAEARKREYHVKAKKRKSYVKWLIENRNKGV